MSFFFLFRKHGAATDNDSVSYIEILSTVVSAIVALCFVQGWLNFYVALVTAIIAIVPIIVFARKRKLFTILQVVQLFTIAVIAFDAAA